MVFGDGLGMGLGLAEIMEVSPNVGLVSSEEEIPDSSLSLSDMWEHRKRAPSASPEESFHQELKQLAPWSQTFHPPELWEIDVCCLRSLVCAVLLWQSRWQDRIIASMGGNVPSSILTTAFLCSSNSLSSGNLGFSWSKCIPLCLHKNTVLIQTCIYSNLHSSWFVALGSWIRTEVPGLIDFMFLEWDTDNKWRRQ